MLQVKGNQRTLRDHIQALHQAEPAPAQACHRQQERRNGAVHTWLTSAYVLDGAAFQAAWAGLARALVVVKTVARGAEVTTTTRTYITSLRTAPVTELANGIRGHWGIENKLHRTRDVQFRQDANGIRHPAATMALLNTLALNHLLTMARESVSAAQIFFAQNIKQFLESQRT